MKSFLYERHFQVHTDSLSEVQSVSAGVPQASVLSPHIFNIYSSDLKTPQNAPHL